MLKAFDYALTTLDPEFPLQTDFQQRVENSSGPIRWLSECRIGFAGVKIPPRKFLTVIAHSLEW